MKKSVLLFRQIFGWLLIVLGGLLGVSSAVCALTALFGGMELDSFGERMRFFAIALMMTAAFFTILWLGIRLKNSGRRNMAAGRVMNPSLPAKKRMQRATNVAVFSDNAADIGQTGQSQEEDVCVLYERNWAGQAAENGADKIFLKVFEDQCVITYERLSRNCYATPPIEDVRTEVRYRLLSTISTWSLEELLRYINGLFRLSINICDCISEQQYLAWIENHNTEFYSMEIMFDGKKQACMVRRENEKFCEEVRFQGQTYFWKESKAIHGLCNYDYAKEVCLNEKAYYLYYTDISSKNYTLWWIVSQITESVFELLQHQPCNNEEIVFEKEIGRIGGDEPERRKRIYIVLALATGRTIGYYRADDGTYKTCLGRIPETVVPNDNHS